MILYGIRNTQTGRLLTITNETYTESEEYWGNYQTHTYVRNQLVDSAYGMVYLWPYKDEVEELLQKDGIDDYRHVRIRDFNKLKEHLVIVETEVDTGFELVT